MIPKNLTTDPLIYGLVPPPLETCLGAPVQPALISALTDMASAARAAGFDLAIASGYRDFARQLLIFNAKARGERPLLNDRGQPVKASNLSTDELLSAILRWSALPGASRHHWGTDIDVYDAGVCVDGYSLALTTAECEGVMAPFHLWLSEYLATQSLFIRPYCQDRGGVAPEPWHLSFAPLAQAYRQAFNVRDLEQVLKAADVALKDAVLARLMALVTRYVV
ncbi:M15 family metallopeptidase [Simiduia aestuariiviva]|uniref:LAS superfamily LD-carboxypeptidase LdcB n=1 Tax=Simiduia aestuariiviva TaxID=1510459 RepID=A0A839UN83_9GAMM|nr:M15 family metallopeptidase [Simiduia aestuariiviva]MBB3169302.1 LAS superfamily LD-carboxypeptidase LdcB [Simiduia aestuariiviva]